MGIDAIQFLRWSARGKVIDALAARDAFQFAVVAGQAHVHRQQQLPGAAHRKHHHH